MEIRSANDYSTPIGIRSSEACLETIFNHSPLGILTADEHGLVTRINQAYLQILGGENREEEIVGRVNALDLGTSPDAGMRDDLARLYLEGHPFQAETLTHSIFGKDAFVHYVVAPIKDENGRVTGCIVNANDITRRRALESTLQYELMMRSAVSQLYEPLVQPDTGIDTISHLVLHYCKVLTSSEHGFVAVVDPENGNLVAHAQDFTADESTAFENNLRCYIFPRDMYGLYPGLMGHAANTKKPVLTNTPNEHPANKGLPPGHLSLKNFISLPVLLGEELVGEICLANASRDYFEQDLEGIARIAKLFALAIQRRRWEHILRESEANLQSLINNTRDLIWAIDHNFRIIAANNSIKYFFHTFYNIKLEIGLPILDLLPPQFREPWEELYQRALKGEQLMEEQVYELKGKKYYYDVFINPIKSNNQVTGISAFARDISERKQAEEQLRIYAATDVMTGVLNRRTGLAVLERQLEMSKRNKNKLSLCFIDLNDLKMVNDLHGHHEGDEYILIVTRILRDSIREADTICRMGGDEFIIIFPDCSQEEAEGVYKRIDEYLRDYNHGHLKPYPVSISHGMAEFGPAQTITAEDLVSLADTRMYDEKRLYKESLAKRD